MTPDGGRAGARTCLLATCETWVSTTTLPVLFKSAGARITSLSPWPLRLSGHVAEKIRGSRDPLEAAAELRALLSARRFDWVVVADDALLRALVEHGGRAALQGWFPVDPLDDDALALLLSKHAFTERAPALEVPVPEFRFASTPEEALEYARGFGFPVVVKGAHGFAGLEVHVVDGESEARKRSAEVIARYGRALVQQFIDGVQAGACVVYDRGEPLGYEAYLADCCYPTANSASTVHESFRHPSIEPVVRAIGRATRFHGLLGIDFMYESKTDELYAIEVNPRPTLGFAGTAANRAFFTPVLASFLRGERTPTAVCKWRARPQVYFPGHVFHFIERADKRSGRAYRQLLACLGEFRLGTVLLAAWETARYIRDRLAALLPLRRTPPRMTASRRPHDSPRSAAPV
jgi:hypothetical protein